jgi:3'(2'), 5'-bisphosphate nucleotidase
VGGFDRERGVAAAAVAAAAKLTVAVRAERVDLGTLAKADRSPVTIADFGSQALICQRLRAAFPVDPIVGEEDAEALRTPNGAATLAAVTGQVRRLLPDASPDDVCDWIDAGGGVVGRRFWTLDPIDGTKGFLRNDQYAIALALVVDGRVEVAALACPALPLGADQPGSLAGTLFVAVRGQGATMAPLAGRASGGFDDCGDGVPIHVARAATGAALRFAESVEPAHSDQHRHAFLARAIGISAPPLRMDSQAKYGALARGDAALYLRLPSPRTPDYREKIWDHAAGSLIVEEAGGRVTDAAGRPLDFAGGRAMTGNRGVVVSNGELHERVLAALVGDGPGQ